MSKLLDVVWGDRQPKHAVNVVHRYIGGLRRVVEPDLPRRGQGRWLTSYAGGYCVEVDAASFDLLQFRDLVTRARAALDQNIALDLLGAALGLWTDRAAADLRDQMTNDSGFLTLDQELAVAAAEAGRLAEAAGRPERVLHGLERAAQIHRTDENLQAVLMRCLAGVGRREQALRTFSALRTQLDEELGVDPGPALRAAHLDILHGRVASFSHRPDRRQIPPPAQLPPDLGIFVGRAVELDSLHRALPEKNASTKVVFISGSAGMGKTSLAVHGGRRLATSFPDGQLYVDLRGFDPTARPLSSSGVLGRFLRALDVPTEKVPDAEEDRAALWRSAVARRRLLVVLDNAKDSRQVRPLLPGGTGSLVIVTSRSQLRGLAHTAQLILPLSSFDADETSDFLVRRLGERRVHDEPTSAVALHEASGGLPLGLALLAAHALHSPQLPLAELGARVARADHTLAPFIDHSNPQGDVRAVLSSSFEAVSQNARRLFVLLALYPGESVQLATAVALGGSTESDTAALLDELVQAGLLVETDADRFARHDLLSRFAAERLADVTPWEADDAEDRMYAESTRRAMAAAWSLTPARRYLSEVRELVEQDRSPAVISDGLAWFDIESRATVALALRACATSRLRLRGWQLAWSLEQYLERRGLWDDLRCVQEAAMAAAAASGLPRAEAISLRALARVDANLDRLQSAADLLNSALAKVDSDRSGPAAELRSELHQTLAWVRDWQGESESALAESEIALTLLESDVAPGLRAKALAAVGWHEALAGNPTAVEHCTEALRLAGADHRTFVVGNARMALGVIYAHMGRYREAVRAHRESVQHFRSVSSVVGEAHALLHFADTLVAVDHPGWALAALGKARDLLINTRHGRRGAVEARIAALRQSPPSASSRRALT